MGSQGELRRQKKKDPSESLRRKVAILLLEVVRFIVKEADNRKHSAHDIHTADKELDIDE